jgi:hypothetical protein
MRTLGGAVATAVYTTVLINEVTDNIKTKVVGYLIEAGVAPTSLPAVLEAVGHRDMESPALQALSVAVLEGVVYQEKLAWAGAFRMVYLVGIAFGGIAVIAAMFSRDVYHLMTNKVEVQLGDPTFVHSKKHTDEKVAE